MNTTSRARARKLLVATIGAATAHYVSGCCNSIAGNLPAPVPDGAGTEAGTPTDAGTSADAAAQADAGTR